MASTKAILGQGIADAQRAVACDHAGAHAEALDLYKAACAKLLHVVRYEGNPSTKGALQARVLSYLARAEQLKESLDAGTKPASSSTPPSSTTSGGGCAASDGRGGGGAAAEDTRGKEEEAPFDLRGELARRIGLDNVKSQIIGLEHRWGESFPS